MYTITYAPEARRFGEIEAQRAGIFYRLVYRIFEAEVHVDILTTYGHYGDK